MFGIGRLGSGGRRPKLFRAGRHLERRRAAKQLTGEPWRCPTAVYSDAEPAHGDIGLLHSTKLKFAFLTSTRLARGIGLAVVLCAPVLAFAADKPASSAGSSGLPLPRFVSLKSDRVNMRNGPSTEYPTSWVYKRAGLPLEVIKEYESWREVRDADGATGWVLQSFLSGRRTALVLPGELKPGKAVPRVQLKATDSGGSGNVAEMEAGVIANLLSCDRKWCYVTIGDYRGYLEQKQLWGVYPDEIVK